MPANSVLAKMAVVISGQTAEFNKAMAQSSGALKSFQNTVRQVGAAIGVSFGTYGVYQGLKYGITVIAGFEKEMSAVRAITNATDQEFQQLSKSALDLGRSTLYGAQSVASLQLAYSRLGFTTKEIIDASSATIDLATATGEDLAKSADIAGVTIRAFGLKASETRRVADILAVGFNKTALGLDNFGEAIKYVAPIAAANNVTLEETTALLGTLADAGIRGSMAGTSLRKIISDLDKNGKPLNERLADLAKKGFSSADAMDEVGRTAYASLLTLVKYTDKTNELTKATQGANGEIAKMAAVMSENLTGDATKLKNAFDGLILTFEHSDTIREFTRALTTLLNVASGNNKGQLNDLLSLLGRGIGEGASQQIIDNFIEDLKVLRYLTGEPIDENSAVAQLALRFKLSKDEAIKLRDAIREVNKAQTDNEIEIENFKKFDERIKKETLDYKGLAASAALYKQSIHEEIESLRERGKVLLASRDQSKQPGADVFDADIKSLNERIRVLKGVNALINEYVESNKENIKAVQSETDNVEKSAAAYDALVKQRELFLQQAKDFAGTNNAFNQDPFSGKGSPLDPKNLEKGVKGMKEYLAQLKTWGSDVQDVYADITGEVTKFTTNFVEAFGAGLVNNFQNFGQNILFALADFMKAFGKQLIAIGVGALALKVAIKNPLVAIAAGIALVAAAGAVASKAQSNLNNVGGGGSVGAVSARAADRRASDFELSGQVVMVQKGTDLVGVINAQNFRANRVGGKKIG